MATNLSDCLSDTAKYIPVDSFLCSLATAQLSQEQGGQSLDVMWPEAVVEGTCMILAMSSFICLDPV